MEGRTGEAVKQAASSIFVRCSPFGVFIGGFTPFYGELCYKKGRIAYGTGETRIVDLF